MDRLKIYKIDDKYISFLSGTDSRVQHNKDSRRPYIGIVLTVSEFRYFVPMESPKPNHRKLKRGKHLFFLDDGKYGLLGFNNMIPVPDEALISFDINSEEDPKYRTLLQRQATFCNRNRAAIFDHAQDTYYDVVNDKNDFLKRISCDFRKLERACRRYNPNYHAQKSKKE